VNSSWVEPPPQQGMGCVGKGCIILFAFFLFLCLAFAGGTYLAVRYLRTSYFVSSQTPLPATTATQEEQQLAKEKWDNFERGERAHEARRIEMTADELNALIASEPDLRGKGYVTIDDDTARLKVSMSLDKVKMLRGRYINAECAVQSAPDGDPSQARFTEILVNGKPVGQDVLNWRGPWGFRRYVEEWTSRGKIKTFEIRDGKVILESRGD
jgi:hypothetical protein